MLLTSLLSIIALSRAGSSLFWKTDQGSSKSVKTSVVTITPVVILLLCSPLLMLLGEPISNFSAAAAEQLSQPSGYIKSVLPNAPLENF